MGGLDVLDAFKIGDGPGDLQNSRIGPCAQPELINSKLQEPLARLIDLAELLDVAVGHLGVAIDLHPFEPAELNDPGSIHPLLDLPGGLPGIAARQVPVFYGRNFILSVTVSLYPPSYHAECIIVEARNNLVEKLLEGPNLPTQAQLDRLWAEEADRRASQIDNGEVEQISAEEVFARIREKCRK